jgi:predicted DNA-binding antitoxin AbrB/MazE fold protein
MTEIVTAVYENGVLRPLETLELRERQTVRLRIIAEGTAEEDERVIRELVQSGVLVPPRGHSEIAPVTEAERRELAEALGRGLDKPLSEEIIDERGEI